MSCSLAGTVQSWAGNTGRPWWADTRAPLARPWAAARRRSGRAPRGVWRHSDRSRRRQRRARRGFPDGESENFQRDLDVYPGNDGPTRCLAAPPRVKSLHEADHGPISSTF